MTAEAIEEMKARAMRTRVRKAATEGREKNKGIHPVIIPREEMAVAAVAVQEDPTRVHRSRNPTRATPAAAEEARGKEKTGFECLKISS